LSKTLSENEKEFRRFAKEFKLMQKILSSEGSFKSMQHATICAGLSEVCEMLADSIKRRRI